MIQIPNLSPAADVPTRCQSLSRDAVFSAVSKVVQSGGLLKKEQDLRVEMGNQNRFLAQLKSRIAEIDRQGAKLLDEMEIGFADKARELEREKAQLLADQSHGQKMLAALQSKQAATATALATEIQRAVGDAVTAIDRALAAQEAKLTNDLKIAAGKILDDLVLTAAARADLAMYTEFKSAIASRILGPANQAKAA